MARYSEPARGVDTKSSQTDMVSEADREAEAAVAELLRAERPDDALVGEEGAGDSGTSGRRWVVDPLDGTTNYLYRFPAWGVSVALEDSGGGLAGVVHDPVANETFRAARGAGAELNGRPIRVNDLDRLDTALIASAAGRPTSCGACCRACATSAVPGPRPSTCASWPADGSTATTSAASTTGTGPRAR
jgi:myo-inositol-1(or 4)-monophosphatase